MTTTLDTYADDTPIPESTLTELFFEAVASDAHASVEDAGSAVVARALRRLDRTAEAGVTDSGTGGASAADGDASFDRRLIRRAMSLPLD